MLSDWHSGMVRKHSIPSLNACVTELLKVLRKAAEFATLTFQLIPKRMEVNENLNF